jgi:hypothetical protein
VFLLFRNTQYTPNPAMPTDSLVARRRQLARQIAPQLASPCHDDGLVLLAVPSLLTPYARKTPGSESPVISQEGHGDS